MKKSTKLSTYLLSLIICLCVSISFGATPIYVSPSGLDTNTGATSAEPVKTVTKAIELVDANGMIILAAGNYSENISITKTLTLRGPLYDVVPTASGRTGSEAIITATTNPVVDIATGITGVIIEGVKFSATPDNAAAPPVPVIKANSAANNGIVRTTVFTSCGSASVGLFSVSGWTVEKNLMSNITGTNNSGVYATSLQNSVIQRNIISTTTYSGIIVDNGSGLKILRNTISNTPRKGIQIANSTTGIITISDNIFTATNTTAAADDGAVTVYVNSTGINVTHNAMIQNCRAFNIRNQAGTVSSAVHVNYNIIYNNTDTAVNNLAQGGGDLDAIKNWWGNDSGPTVASNPTGTGDKASTNVLYDPWVGKASTLSAGGSLSSMAKTFTLTDGSAITATSNVLTGATFLALFEETTAFPQGYTGMVNEKALANKRLIVASNVPEGKGFATIKIAYLDSDLTVLGATAETDLRISVWDEAQARWVSAVDSNSTGTPQFMGDSTPDTTLGHYGVNVAGNYVWANVDHFCEFAAGLGNTVSEVETWSLY